MLITIAVCMGVVKWLAPSVKNPPAASLPKQTITVSISGAVVNPGTYKASSDDTLHELVIMAGGFAQGADMGAVNLSNPLKGFLGDIIIPYAVKPKPPEKPPKPGDVKFPLNINEATALELQALPGVGPALARRIVKYRKEHGSFKKTSELMNVEGVGPKLYENLFGLITVSESLPWEQ